MRCIRPALNWIAVASSVLCPLVWGQQAADVKPIILVNDKLEELRRESLLVPLRMRIRDVRQGPDELLYVLVDHENGGVLRIEPSATEQKPTTSSARPPR